MLEQITFPFYFAHRGASAYAPENTLAAFQLAVEQGAPAVEFDVKLTRDRYVVIIHDHTLARTTNGKGHVGEMKLAALRELDAGSWFGEKFRGEKIPTLDDALEAVGRKVFINIELTNYTSPSDRLVHEVTRVVQRHGMDSRVLFSSFFPTNLFLARSSMPKVPRGQLAWQGVAGKWQQLVGRIADIQAEHPAAADVTAESVSAAHARGRRVFVYTVNSPDEMRHLRALGVDGIFTDDPLAAEQHFVN